MNFLILAFFPIQMGREAKSSSAFCLTVSSSVSPFPLTFYYKQQGEASLHLQQSQKHLNLFKHLLQQDPSS